MKAWAFGLIFAMVVAAQAAPVDTYLAKRDRAIATLKANPSSRTAIGYEKRVLAELQTSGPYAKAARCRRFFRKGTINLETLVEDQGYGQLDGLVYTAPRPSTRVVLSSDALLAAWLKSRTDVLKDPASAIRTEAFYLQALGGDAAFATFASCRSRQGCGPVFRTASAETAGHQRRTAR